MAVKQPDFEKAAQNMYAAADKIILIPKIPVIAQGDLIIKQLEEIRADNKERHHDLKCLQDEVQEHRDDSRRLRGEVQEQRDDLRCFRDEVQAQIQPLTSQVQTLSSQFQTLSGQFQTLSGQFQVFNDNQDLLPLRLYNSILGGTGTIRYPHGFDEIERPRTKGDLREYTEDNCTRLIGALGLQQVPLGSHVVVFRNRIADYLGVFLD